jgi:hypothetical protein
LNVRLLYESDLIDEKLVESLKFGNDFRIIINLHLIGKKDGNISNINVI